MFGKIQNRKASLENFLAEKAKTKWLFPNKNKNLHTANFYRGLKKASQFFPSVGRKMKVFFQHDR